MLGVWLFGLVYIDFVCIINVFFDFELGIEDCFCGCMYDELDCVFDEWVE